MFQCNSEQILSGTIANPERHDSGTLLLQPNPKANRHTFEAKKQI